MRSKNLTVRTVSILFSLVDNISDSRLIQKTIQKIVENCQLEFGKDNISGGQLFPNPDRKWQDQRRVCLYTTPGVKYMVGSYLREYRIRDEKVINPNIEFGSRAS